MVSWPAPLRAIHEEVSRLRPPESNLDELRPAWEAHLAQVQAAIPGIHVEDEGEVLYLGVLSPGCQACKDGTWDCIFTTMRCNLDCDFCYSPHAIPRDYSGSLLGSTPDEIAQNHAKTRITGLSFSGGEPFAEPESLFEWVGWFTERYPDKYYWVYTNGLLAGEDKLRRLAELGVDEVRFNLAATGYDHPTALANLAAAARHLPHVTVEIPAIPEHADRLLSSLAGWAARGARFLNLHELMYEPGTNSAALPGPRQEIVTADGHCSAIHLGSRALTLTVMRRIQDESLPLAVNDCSLQSKLRQLRGRRASLAPLVQAPHEKLVGGQTYESCCAYRGEDDYFFFSPDSLAEMRGRYPGYCFVRLARTAPLSLHDPGRWLLFENLSGPEGL
jgi:pyruvate formate-lyase activating enzyme-like uncharacterized protein